jgi:hypothetical protein
LQQVHTLVGEGSGDQDGEGGQAYVSPDLSKVSFISSSNLLRDLTRLSQLSVSIDAKNIKKSKGARCLIQIAITKYKQKGNQA